MAKYTVNKKFEDIHTGDVYGVGDTIDMTVKRAKEVADNLDDTFLTRVEEEKNED